MLNTKTGVSDKWEIWGCPRLQQPHKGWAMTRGSKSPSLALIFRIAWRVWFIDWDKLQMRWADIKWALGSKIISRALVLQEYIRIELFTTTWQIFIQVYPQNFYKVVSYIYYGRSTCQYTQLLWTKLNINCNVEKLLYFLKK